MGKSITGKTLVTRVYTDEAKTFGFKTSSMLPSYKVLFGFNWSDDATYTRPLRKIGEGFRIQFGGQMVAVAADVPDRIYKKADTIKFIPGARRAFRALFYHEMGHLLYTDMYDDRIIKYKKPELRGFIHSLFNILEDIVIERYGMSVDYPYTAKYFKFLTKQIFVPQCKSYKDNPKNPNAFLNFLLLKLRCKTDFKGTSQVWEDNKKYLVAMVKSILMEEDPTERITKSIILAEWLIKKTKWDFTKDPVNDPKGSVSGILSGKGMPGGGAGGTGAGPAPRKTSPGKKKGKGKGKGKDGEEGEGEETPKKGKTKSAEENGGGGDKSDGPGENDGCGGSHNNRGGDSGMSNPDDAPDLKTKDELEDLDDNDEEIEDNYEQDNDLLLDHCDEVDDAFNETLREGDNHQFVLAKDYYLPTDRVKDVINQKLNEVSQLTNAVKTAFAVYKGRIRPRYNRGFYSGKLDMRKAMQNTLTGGCDLKLFQKKIANGIAPDLAVSILCDNSGSMSGNKSRVCTTAMLALARACQLCNIPIEVSCFTECWSMNYTIRMKRFEDSFDNAKDFLGITDYDVYSHYIDDDNLQNLQFCGNEDEVNLYYIWKEFQRNKHKDKLIIVISDGETCGSSDTLRKLVKEIEASGISIMGLGIQSRAVASLYTNYKLFDTKESLDGLPEFLTSTLFKFAKGGK